jgi:hypothetical protein
MKSRTLIALIVCLAASFALSPASTEQLLPGEREAVVKEIPGVVAAGAKWEFVSAGFQTADGIVGTPDGGVLLAQEQSNTIRKLDAAGMGGGTTWVQPDRAERLALEAVTPAVELGADLNADNGDGRTALDAAKASFLVEKGATRGRDEKEAEQAPTPAPSKRWPAPRTLDGRPDLQGIWTNATVTPLERPRELAGKEFFTGREAAEYERRMVEQNNADRRRDDPDADLAIGYNDAWWERGTKVVSTSRTSLIVDPPNGTIPPLTPDAQAKAAARAEARRLRPADGPQDRTLADRCIVRGTSGPPMLPAGYSNNYQIVQGRDHVVILVEMIHDARIIPLDGRPHLAASVRQLMGDPRARWEGDTLVVETTNFTDKTNFRGSGEHLRVTERFTRIDEDTLLYQFTVDDPHSFTRRWSGEIPMKKADGPLFEYACHEGNLSMEYILRAARAEERAAEEANRREVR